MIRAARRDYLDRPPGPDFARIERDIDAFLAEQAAGAPLHPIDEAEAWILARLRDDPEA